MTPQRKYRFLFVHFLILGMDTMYRNLRAEISTMEEIESTWLPIELNPPERVAQFKAIQRNHALMFGLVGRSRVRALQRAGKQFDAAFFNHMFPASFLIDFRKQVPSVDSMDVTSIQLLKFGQAYYATKREYSMGPIRRMKRWIATRVYASSRKLMPWSQFTKNSLMNDYRMPEHKIEIIGPGVDLMKWRRDGTPRDNSKNVQVLFVGGDFVRKGGDVLLQVAQRDEFRDCEFHVVTRSFAGTQPRNVHVYRDMTANTSALMELYQKADVFVMPTRSDFAPTSSVCEAMAMELPVITTSVGGLDEVVVHGVTGLIAPVGEAEGLATQLRTLVTNRTLRRDIGLNARQHVEEHFNLATNARKTVEIMKAAAGRTAHGNSPIR